jgi:hypothetical protein
VRETICSSEKNGRLCQAQTALRFYQQCVHKICGQYEEDHHSTNIWNRDLTESERVPNTGACFPPAAQRRHADIRQYDQNEPFVGQYQSAD